MKNSEKPIAIILDKDGDVKHEAALKNKKFLNDCLLGLTKREYFAAFAMQGFIANANVIWEEIPKSSVKYADALLKELEKENGQ